MLSAQMTFQLRDPSETVVLDVNPYRVFHQDPQSVSLSARGVRVVCQGHANYETQVVPARLTTGQRYFYYLSDVLPDWLKDMKTHCSCGRGDWCGILAEGVLQL